MTAADMERLDTPLAVLAARVDALNALKRTRMAAGLLAEERHQCDPDDAAFALLPCPHPEACSTDADYPEWAVDLAEQIRASNTTRRTR
ncbi:hypothetical protein GTY67_13755 [Streptomyces sp. SID8374]|uniref:hypothetical protein n=1 Tax=Streptomyces sp. SID8374 TaxID=2690354 RepID=UPI00136F87FD|nr:hypothetical protein [Streptomyces sp. SID8374]MYX14463.1 hypothetical protein [Streptomyces sp. SID8374]